MKDDEKYCSDYDEEIAHLIEAIAELNGEFKGFVEKAEKNVPSGMEYEDVFEWRLCSVYIDSVLAREEHISHEFLLAIYRSLKNFIVVDGLKLSHTPLKNFEFLFDLFALERWVHREINISKIYHSDFPHNLGTLYPEPREELRMKDFIGQVAKRVAQ